MTSVGIADIEGFAERRNSLLLRLREKPELSDWSELYTNLVDELVQASCESVLGSHPEAPPISIVATGGYGRRELAPYSDVDLTVVPLQEAAPGLDAAIKDLFRVLHSAIGTTLGLELGYAYRLVNDAPGLDEKSRTGLLDARLVAGSAEPLDALTDLYWQTFPVADFLISKIEERRTNFAKYNDTPLVVEPHLKEGAGGLRCFQAANWLRMAMGERPLRRTKAYGWMLQLRNLLHLASGRRQDLLSRQRQSEIADILGADVYAMMSRCAGEALELHQEYLLAREALLEARFSLGGGVTAMRGEARILSTVPVSTAAAGISKATQLGLQVPNEAFATTDEIDGPVALGAVSMGEPALRNLEKCGLLKRLLPELTACKTLMPRDAAHCFTVYEHTLQAVKVLDRLSRGFWLGDLKANIRDLGPLYLALLLHDVGKLEGEETHAELGAIAATRVCERWGLGGQVNNLVVWLIRDHLTMARFIGMRDVLNPSTIEEFAGLVRDQERLEMLTLLTYADTKALGTNSLTPTQETFLRELFERTSRLFEGDSVGDSDPSIVRKRLQRELKRQQLPESEVQDFLGSMPAHYLATTPPDLVPLHIRYEQQARSGDPVIELHDDLSLLATELTVCCLDQSGLLSAILGVIYAYDLSIHGIRASTSSSESPVALDAFTISFGGKPLPSATSRQLASGLEKVLKGDLRYEQIMAERGKDPNRAQHNFSYTYVEGLPSILEIQAPRGRGMAFRISRLISQQGWNITAARVGQWGGRGAAAFYIAAKDGSQIPRDEVEIALRHS